MELFSVKGKQANDYENGYTDQVINGCKQTSIWNSAKVDTENVIKYKNIKLRMLSWVIDKSLEKDWV